jgi:hypothetical protein
MLKLEISAWFDLETVGFTWPRLVSACGRPCWIQPSSRYQPQHGPFHRSPSRRRLFTCSLCRVSLSNLSSFHQLAGPRWNDRFNASRTELESSPRTAHRFLCWSCSYQPPSSSLINRTIRGGHSNRNSEGTCFFLFLFVIVIIVIRRHGDNQHVACL